MPNFRTVLAATAIVSTFTKAQLVQSEELPQTQMAAAAVVMRQILLFPCYYGGHDFDAGSIQIIDDKIAHLIGHVMSGCGSRGVYDVDIDVVKLSDCVFHAVKPKTSSILATLYLEALSDEYRQTPALNPWGILITAVGGGKSPALCVNSDDHKTHACFNDLPLGYLLYGHAYSYKDFSGRAFRAVQFLQRNCPPQPRGF